MSRAACWTPDHLRRLALAYTESSGEVSDQKLTSVAETMTKHFDWRGCVSKASSLVSGYDGTFDDRLGHQNHQGAVLMVIAARRCLSLEVRGLRRFFPRACP